MIELAINRAYVSGITSPSPPNDLCPICRPKWGNVMPEVREVWSGLRPDSVGGLGLDVMPRP